MIQWLLLVIGLTHVNPVSSDHFSNKYNFTWYDRQLLSHISLINIHLTLIMYMGYFSTCGRTFFIAVM